MEITSSFSDTASANMAADDLLDGTLLYVMTSVGADKIIFVDSDRDGVADISAIFVGQADFSMYDIA